MNNEIGRKITSLTLMTIMIAGGMIFAVPGSMPAAHAQANANLFVSVEQSFKPDRFGGAMVVEVVVNDPALKDRDKPTAEPDVTVNGKDLRMVQASDGSWYAYFADLTKAKNADTLSVTNGTSLDFGKGCTAASAPAGIGLLTGGFSDTEGVFMNTNNPNIAPGTLGVCVSDFTALNKNNTNNVVREPKTPTNPSGTNTKI